MNSSILSLNALSSLLKPVPMWAAVKSYFLFALLVFFSWRDNFFGFCHASRCRPEEREALLTFKQGLRDPSRRLSSWAAGRDCCTWRGVRCHNITGHVIGLSLRNPFANPLLSDIFSISLAEFDAYNLSSLSGNISSSLTQLKKLRHLDLSQNNFGGVRVPEFFGSLTNLRYLDLTSMGFGGAIPPQLGNLSSLRWLALGDNSGMNVDKGLDWIPRLSSLEFLDLSEVNLSKASNWLQIVSTLPSLFELHLLDCFLDPYNTPRSHFNLSSLAILDLSMNNLGPSVSQWLIQSLPPLLSSLDLSSNHIVGTFPSSLKNMTKIQALRLGGNGFNSTIPDWLYDHTSLKALDLSDNEFQGSISQAIGNLTSLVELHLSNNKFGGEIPESIKALCNLRVLNLMWNNLVGCLSKYIGYLSLCMRERLEVLSLSGSQVSSHLSDRIGDFIELSQLYISSCGLNGTVPESIGHLTKLEILVISNNSLTGTLSQEHFVNLTNLQALDVSINPGLGFEFNDTWIPPFQLLGLYMCNTKLGPQWPTWLQTQKDLKKLQIHNARISHPIPTWISSLPNLSHLDLSNNHIPGPIPDLPVLEYINLGSNDLAGSLPNISPRLWVLDLSNNSYSGSLASCMCRNVSNQKNNLASLDLSKNHLSGELPDCWANWENLQDIRLNDNNFTGKIPKSMASLVLIGSLLLRKNNLSGNLSHSLHNWNSLQVLDLSENSFSGTIPESMRQLLPRLRFVVLRSNKLGGSIPLELCDLKSLQSLDLANNNISGTIPKCFGNFSAMYQQEVQRYIEFQEKMLFAMKGRIYEYESNLRWLATIDLSCNSLSGGIPAELTDLDGLKGLNLSSNKLKGKIPTRIGSMKSLESLDLSKNQLSGQIPHSIADLNFLSWLNLSYNHLSGRIPSGTQIQGFLRSFLGNGDLCGPPLPNSCAGDHEHEPAASAHGNDNESEEDGWIDMKWFYLGAPFGFVVGFWAVLLPLALNKARRRAYFRFLDDIKYKLLG